MIINNPKPYYMGRRVFVYRNLTKKCLSIKCNGRVVGHAHTVQLLNVEFRVQRGGQRRVRTSGHKNVHAGVVGILTGFKPLGTHTTQVYYNPHKVDTFVIKSTGNPVHEAVSTLITGGKIYI